MHTEYLPETSTTLPSDIYLVRITKILAFFTANAAIMEIELRLSYNYF